MMSSTDKRIVQYVSAGAVLASIGVLILRIFFGPVATLPEIEQPLAQINIDWGILRDPLEIKLPSFSVTLQPSSTSTTASTSISLLAIVDGWAKGPFVYSFDCENDGIFELETEETSRKDYKAENLCIYKEGHYRANVSVKGTFNYYKTKDSIIEELHEASALTNIFVQSSNNPPIISFCDVAPTEGTTQSNYVFTFLLEASDLDEDNLTYLWEFGDTATSTEKSPLYVYKNPGFYMPKVSVFDTKGGKASCVANSLMILNQLIPFQKISLPNKVGRVNPFAKIGEDMEENENATTTQDVPTTTPET